MVRLSQRPGSTLTAVRASHSRSRLRFLISLLHHLSAKPQLYILAAEERLVFTGDIDAFTNRTDLTGKEEFKEVVRDIISLDK